jgi:hypothetical protein
VEEAVTSGRVQHELRPGTSRAANDGDGGRCGLYTENSAFSGGRLELHTAAAAVAAAAAAMDKFSNNPGSEGSDRCRVLLFEK